jgi:hypothetical protein
MFCCRIYEICSNILLVIERSGTLAVLFKFPSPEVLGVCISVYLFKLFQLYRFCSVRWENNQKHELRIM